MKIKSKRMKLTKAGYFVCAERYGQYVIKKITLTIIVVTIFLSVTAQTVFDIQVDKLYLDDDNIAFVNEGELNNYACTIRPLQVKDFEHKLVLECEEDNQWWWSEDTMRIEFENIKEFNTPKELIDWIMDRKFAKESNINNLKHNSYIQHFSNHLFAQISFKNYNSEKPEWSFYEADFWDYVFIRINGKHLIIALVYEESADIGGFIIPMEDETIVVSKNFQYFEEGKKIDTIQLSKHIPLKSFYRIREVNNGFELRDKLFQEPILDEVYQQIELGENLILCKNNKNITIYDKSASIVIGKNLKAAYDSFGSIQCIRENKIQWLDYDGVVHDTFPKPNWGLCGTISSTDRRIVSSKKAFLEFYETGYGGQKRIRDSIAISKSNSFQSIKYLNNSTEHSFDEYSGLLAVFTYPYSYYYAEQDNTQKLLSITNKRDATELDLIRKRNNAKDQNEKDNIDSLIKNLKDEIEIEIKYEGEFEPFGYYHPIRIKEGNLYGYYPQNDKAKYKKIEKFNFFFAEFENENGKKGWLDIYGKEYFKE